MELYCDTEFKTFKDEHLIHEYGEFPHEYTGEITKSFAIKQAKKDGWTFKKDGRVFCPKCSEGKK